MMDDGIIHVSGTGCALADFLYTRVRFDSPRFAKYMSVKDGDGGISPGKLVFTEELEKFAGRPYREILSELIGTQSFEGFNIGGPAIVSMIHASQLLSQGPFKVSFYGCTGDDEVAGYIHNIISKIPIDCTNYIKLNSLPTAFTDVLSDPVYDNGNGERSFINNIGASLHYSAEMLPSGFFNAHIVCFGGTALVPQIHDQLTMLLNKAKENGCITIVNTVFDFRNEKNNPGNPWPLGDTEESFRLTDVLIMDAEEAIKISGKKSVEKAADYFSHQKLSSFFITNGSKNVFAYSNGQFFDYIGLNQYPVSDLIVNELKNDLRKGDSTGCGDNFAGGIIASVAMQLQRKHHGPFNMFEALSWGIASGGFACFYLGGTYQENKKGEKLGKIKHYQEAYLSQIDQNIK